MTAKPIRNPGRGVRLGLCALWACVGAAVAGTALAGDAGAAPPPALSQGLGRMEDVGVVHVLYGASDGLGAARAQLWRQGEGGVAEVAEHWDRFGMALAAGDYNGDGYADLAMGAPHEGLGALRNVGMVHVLYGSADGLRAAGSQLWQQGAGGLLGVGEDGDQFGAMLAAGDLNGDGRADLAIAIPNKTVDGAAKAGAVAVLYGFAGGLTAAGNQVWHQNSPGVADNAEANDGFGQALAIGDWNRDGRADLAIGVPNEDLGAVRDAGVVHIVFGSPAGLTSVGSQLWSQDSPGVEDAAEADERFGAALASGDINGDSYPDLAIGVPDEAVGGLQSAGAVQMLFGSSAGLTAVGSQFWHQDAIGAPDKSQARDQFGRALACGDLNGDGYADLAVGLPGQNLWGGAFAGAVVVLHGSSAGLTVVGNQFWSQESPGISGDSSGDESFGRVLAAGDLNGDGYADLAVGAPGDKRGNWLYAGSINVFYGSAAGLTAQGAQYWTQGNSGLMDVAEEGDNLSTALATGDFDRDGRGDLAASAPYEDLDRYGVYVPLLRR